MAGNTEEPGAIVDWGYLNSRYSPGQKVSPNFKVRSHPCDLPSSVLCAGHVHVHQAHDVHTLSFTGFRSYCSGPRVCPLLHNLPYSSSDLLWALERRPGTQPPHKALESLPWGSGSRPLLPQPSPFRSSSAWPLVLQERQALGPGTKWALDDPSLAGSHHL